MLQTIHLNNLRQSLTTLYLSALLTSQLIDLTPKLLLERLRAGNRRNIIFLPVSSSSSLLLLFLCEMFRALCPDFV